MLFIKKYLVGRLLKLSIVTKPNVYQNHIEVIKSNTFKALKIKHATEH